MRILQVTSDWKWTGPAAPMLDLCRALADRGHDVRLCCPEPPPGASASLLQQAREVGLAPDLLLERGRGVHWRRDGADAAALRSLVDVRDVGILHAWHTRDHVLAVRAARARRRQQRTALVRSQKSAEAIAAWPWNRWLFGPACDGLLCVSPAAAQRNLRLRGGRPILGSFGGVDLARFRPGPPEKPAREALGLAAEHRVVAIVARAQRHRRFDLLLAAAALWMRRDPAGRLLVVGRGTHIEEVAVAPARRLGIADRVVFAGYRDTDYVDVLRCADAVTFLVPGSDGGCRALLEAAACGLPAVTTRRGALPEIVVDGETGFVVDEEAPALGGAFARLFDDAALRRRFAAAARRRAEAHFGTAGLAARVEAFYEALLAR